MITKTALIAALSITAVPPSADVPEPPPITLTYKQVMTMQAVIQTLQKDKESAEEDMVYWYKKATECGNKSRKRET